MNLEADKTSTAVATLGKPASIRAQTANLRAYWLGWGGEIGTDLPVYRSGLRHPLLNGVLRVQHQSAEAALAEAGRRLAGVPYVWWVGPDSRPGLADELVALGANRMSRLPLMAVDLARVPAEEPPPGLTIRQVTSRADLIDYADVCAEAFAIPDDQIGGFVEAEAADRSAYSYNVRFVGRVAGRAVATSALSISHGVAGIYWVATRAEHRGRGIGRAVTTAALLAGRERGLRIGTLQASGLGEPVYRRIGFQTVGHCEHLSPA
ncbi:GNAT family N-acetyltransferase [Virgisporangium aliadipatigenens]|nr:GNAT family N-acetyltransferase [Virgisporangium aliadipatigenens]